MQRPRLTPTTGPAHLAIFSLLALWPGQASAAPDWLTAMPHVGVLVRNMSDAPAETVQKAEDVCQQVFRGAGIRITWINRVDDITWQGPDLVLRAAIVPRAPASRPIDSFGTALPLKRDGIQLFLYHERIVALSRLAAMPVSVVLAVALAHEIGHLLLESREHTAAGVMRAQWGLHELNEVRQGVLRFTGDQSRRMRANVQSLAAGGSALGKARLLMSYGGRPTRR